MKGWKPQYFDRHNYKLGTVTIMMGTLQPPNFISIEEMPSATGQRQRQRGQISVVSHKTTNIIIPLRRIIVFVKKKLIKK